MFLENYIYLKEHVMYLKNYSKKKKKFLKKSLNFFLWKSFFGQNDYDILKQSKQVGSLICDFTLLSCASYLITIMCVLIVICHVHWSR
jgi:hypothetical protein